jgi:hypothetical protein
MAFVVIKSIRAVICFKCRDRLLIAVDYAQVGVFRVAEYKGFSGFFEGDDDGGFESETFFLLSFNLTVKFLNGELSNEGLGGPL